MLLKILFLVILIQVICGKEEATLGEFPWTVSLRLSGFVGHDCGVCKRLRDFDNHSFRLEPI
jgi:hypothetical protein